MQPRQTEEKAVDRGEEKEDIGVEGIEGGHVQLCVQLYSPPRLTTHTHLVTRGLRRGFADE